MNKRDPQQQPDLPGKTGEGRVVSPYRRIWRRIENVLFSLMVALVFIYFVLQSSFVQNWLIGKITGYLSSELQTTVRIQHVDISFFDNLLLEGFFVADLQGDTLLSARRLKAGLNSNIFSLFRNRLEFNDLSLQGAKFNLRRREGATGNNLQFILDYFARPDTTAKPPKPFSIRVKNLRLTEVQFLMEDAVAGKRMYAYLPAGNIRVNNLDLQSMSMDIQSVSLNGPVFTISEWEASPDAQPAKAPESRPVSKQFPVDTVPANPSLLQIRIGRLSLSDGRFALDRFDQSPARQTPAGVMDYEHIAVRQIFLEADSVYADANLFFTGALRHLEAVEDCGVRIKQLTANKVHVSDTLTALYGMRLETNGSVLGDTLAMRYRTYRDFNQFVDRVRLEGLLDSGSQVRIGDIMFFSPDVEETPFFINNRDKIVEIQGQIDGRINRLNGRNLKIRLGKDTYIHGNFDGDDLAAGTDRMRFFLNFERARTTVRTIRTVIPGFNPPAYFDALGHINFKGTYQILFGTNHIFNGDLVSDLGTGTLDMKLDLAGGLEKATYSGYLNMSRFDLGRWTGNPDFGKSTFRVNITKGEGLTIKTIKTKLTGIVDSFYFRGYNYQNVRLNGGFENALFSGNMDMKDPNIDFTFDGTITLQDSIPEYDFRADLRRIDLGALNLVQKDWVLSGSVEKIKLFARGWDDMKGSIMLRNFNLIENKKEEHRFDSLLFVATSLPNGNRYFLLLSDLAAGVLEGRFEFDQMAYNALGFYYQHFPDLVRQAYGKPVLDTVPVANNYKINLLIKDTRNWTHLIDPNLDTLRNLNFRVSVNAELGASDIQIQTPGLRYDGISLRDFDFKWNNLYSQGNFNLSIPEALLANGQQLAQLKLSGNVNKNALEFSLKTEDTTAIIKKINLNGVLSTVDSFWQVHFNTSNIALFDQQWYMDEDNYLRFSSTQFEARNFDLANENQRIIIESFNEGKGARFSLANFDLNFLEQFYKLNNLSYRAKIFNLDFEVYDLFGLKDIQAYITTDTVFLNEKPFGQLIGNLEMADVNSPLWCKVFLKDGDAYSLRVLGALAPEGQPKQTVAELGTVQPGQFQALVNSTNFPLEVLELFIPEISKTKGTIDADVRLGGPLNKVGMKGQAKVNGHFQLDYLKALFYIPNQTITLSEYQLWAEGDTLLDGSQKNIAIIKGGLRHDHFRDWLLDCEINTLSSNFMVMNTLREDNALYYGQGIGKFSAKFTGSFAKTDISVTASTGNYTRLFIPLASDNTDIQDVNFITFVDKKQATGSKASTGKQFVLSDLRGLNFEMNLSITDEAEVQLIFDEQAGDIVKGRGVGNIRLTINREGEFKMYGQYTIRRGEYLFTLLNWVNKPFTVADGGTINWYGDPYAAQISLDATYAENTSLYNLIRDELAATNSLGSEATKSTKVIVTMHLKGDLFKPNISFDLSFPNTSSQLKSLVDSKLSQMRQDQNEMTRQVFGLIVVGSFLPPTGASTIQSSDYIASAFNTLTQVLSNQFSNYLTALASEWFGGAVSSIDFDIAYNEYRNQLSDPGQPNLAQIGRELQVRLTSGFANDRITVQVGSQFGLGQPGTATADGFLGEDVTVEIQITENRQWRLKVYQRTEPDIAGGARRSRYGFGISFRKDYESFSELIDGLTGWFRGGKKS